MVVYRVLTPSAPSYDLRPNETLQSISLSSYNGYASGLPSLGLILVTDAYRRPDNIGVAVPRTETLLLLADIDIEDSRFDVHEETTKENRDIPPATNL
jgi:hypothetical protein